jgi:hypothetical protein
MAVTINASTTSGLIQSADTSGQINLQSNGTTVLGVTSSGSTVTGTQSVSGDLSFNSGYGSAAVAYGCRAWVNFNGTGTVAIRSSGNVSSITDNGTGDYTINFSSAMPDTNYSIAGLSQNNATSPPSAYVSIGPGSAGTSTNFLLTSSARISTGVYGVSSSADSGFVTAAVFR